MKEYPLLRQYCLTKITHSAPLSSPPPAHTCIFIKHTHTRTHTQVRTLSCVIAFAARSSSSASSPPSSFSPPSPPPFPFLTTVAEEEEEGRIDDPRSSSRDPGPFSSRLLKSASRRDVKDVVEEVVEDFAFSTEASLLFAEPFLSSSLFLSLFLSFLFLFLI